jgi:hypothetical protein
MIMSTAAMATLVTMSYSFIAFPYAN